MASPSAHPFERTPHRTLIGLSLPVLLSLTAEPLTGLVDTAFVARLGAEALAALGVGTMVLSSIFWIFNFLGIGTQTEVGQALGRQTPERAAQMTGLALVLATGFGVLAIVLGWPLTSPMAVGMGASGAMLDGAVTYIRIRWFGAPAVLVTLVAFGALRGVQDMKTPLWIAVAVNALNILLDAILIFGYGPFPALGIAGAAWASVVSQWLGAGWALWAVYRRLGKPGALPLREMVKLLVVGGDLFVRTGFLTLFLILTTRAATRIGVEAGAAHQAIRQVWVFTALFLDAFAITAQSLVAYFMGAQDLKHARQVARVACQWSLGAGVALGVVMWIGKDAVAALLVPPEAWVVFGPAWLVAALVQPINALPFATDGIHWGTGDFRYLRNVVVLATIIGAIGIYLVDETAPQALTWVWIVTAVWIAVRALFGVLRIWPGIGNGPLRRHSA